MIAGPASLLAQTRGEDGLTEFERSTAKQLGLDASKYKAIPQRPASVAAPHATVNHPLCAGKEGLEKTRCELLIASSGVSGIPSCVSSLDMYEFCRLAAENLTEGRIVSAQLTRVSRDLGFLPMYSGLVQIESGKIIEMVLLSRDKSE